jgi:hypothetical protein
MLYSILIYGDEGHVAGWTPEKEKEVMGRHAQLRQELTAAGRLGPVMRLSPEGTKIVRRYKDRQSVIDGPFAETKEQLMGIVTLEFGVGAEKTDGSAPGCRPEGRTAGG